MRVMVTGANGVIGRALVYRLLAEGSIQGRPIEALLLLDAVLTGFPEDRRLRCHVAGMNDVALLRRALADGVDVVFHLANVPSRCAQMPYGRGYASTLFGSLELLQQLRGLKRPSVFVYASSTEVHGGVLAAESRDVQTLQLDFSQGAHKLMVEIALLDLARRGEVDGRVIRLPAIVEHHRSGDGPGFVGELLQSYVQKVAYCWPVSADVLIGWMSVRCCVDNLLHAAGVDALGTERVWQLPVLRLSTAQVLDRLAASFGIAPRALISFAPDTTLEGLLGHCIRAGTHKARALGFRHDGSVAALIRNTLDQPVAWSAMPEVDRSKVDGN